LNHKIRSFPSLDSPEALVRNAADKMPSTKERVQAGGCLIFVLILGFWGLWGLKTALVERAPTRVSFADYARQPGKAQWLELHDVRPDFDNLVWMESVTGSIKGVYVPLQPRNEKPLAKTPAVLFAKEGDLAVLASWIKASKDKTTGPEVERAREIMAQLDEKMHTISGLVVRGLDKDKSADRALQTLDGTTTPDPRIIAWKEEPSFGFHIFILVVCAFFGIGAIARLFAKRDDKIPELRD
jgi:hypothetical protein